MKSFFSVSVLSVFLFGTILNATVHEVPDGYATIGDAITASVTGDTILVFPGMYTETTTIQDKDLVIGSLFLTTGDTSYIASTVIKPAAGAVFKYLGSVSQQSRLVGFTVDADWMDLPEIIFAATGADISLENLRITGNGTTDLNRVAVRVMDSSTLLDHVRIYGNGGTGLYAEASSVIITNSQFKNNRKTGISINKSSLDVSDSDISQNGYSGILASSSELSVRNVNIIGNTSYSGAGINTNYTNAIIERTLIAENKTQTGSTSAGGGLYFFASNSTKIINCTIVNNEANVYAGGIFAYASSVVKIINSILWGNNANGLPEIGSWSGANVHVGYSNIRGGPSAQNALYNGVFTWYDNILGADITGDNPSLDENYHLSAGSPGIDQGAALYSMGDDLMVDMPAGSWNGAAPDLGIHEFTGAVPAIVAYFTVLTAPHGPAPLSVRFSDMSIAENTTITSWNWDFGDGGRSTLQAPAHTYESPGSFSVSLTVSDGELTDTRTVDEMVTVFPPEIQANFSFTPDSGAAPFFVQFTDLSTGTISNYFWDFGDGGSSTQTNPAYIYEASGNYTVTLTVSNDFTSDTMAVSDAVTVTGAVSHNTWHVATTGSDETGDGTVTNPFAGIQKGIDMAAEGDTILVKDGAYVSPVQGQELIGKALVIRSDNGPENCIIRAATKHSGEGFLIKQVGQNAVISGFTLLNFYDGFFVMNASPVIEHCIIDSSTYGIMTSRDWSAVEGQSPTSPLIRYNLIKNSELDGIQSFEEGSPRIINNTIVHNGDFGIQTGFTNAHVYNNIIAYNLTGLSDAIPDDGIVEHGYNLLWDNTTQYAGVSPAVGEIASDPLLDDSTYHLTSGSPAIDSGHPDYQPDSDGTRPDMGAFYFHQEPADWFAAFHADVTTGRAPLVVNFTDQSTGNPISWNWNFGDESTSTSQHPSHTYTEPGTYSVSLEVSDGTEIRTVENNAYITVHEPVQQNPVDSPFEQLTSLPGTEGDHYRDGAFISKDIVYIVTDKNQLFKTTDGGTSWTDISPEQGTDFSGLGASPRVSFINENTGAVAFSLDDGSNNYDYDVVFGYVWCTTDGGQTWSQRFDVNDDMVAHLQQVNETTLYISGTARFGVTSTRWFKKIIRDPNTGTYTLSNITPMPTSRPHVYSGHWLNQNTGVVMARLNVAPWTMEPFITRDGGQTWTSIQGNLPVLNNTTVSFSDRAIQMLGENSIIIAHGEPQGDSTVTRIRRTDNGGITWYNATFDKTPHQLVNLRIDAKSGVGFATGWYGDKALYRTRDYGTSWEQYAPENISDALVFYGVDIALDGTAWAFGHYQNLWRSRTTMTPEFIADVTEGPIPLEVHFTDLTVPGMAPVTEIHWDFGDGNGSDEQHPVHVYTQPGDFTVTLTATDSTGDYSITKENYISTGLNASAIVFTVLDVPEDQGGWVTVTFSRSFYDTLRPPAVTEEDSVGIYTVEILDGERWTAANSTAAYGQDSYQILVHTYSDSSVHGDGLHDFRIISALPGGRFISPVVQGYSIDNLAPAIPTGLGGQWLASDELKISWDPSDAPDFGYYILWKSQDPEFDPQTTDYLAELIDTVYIDTEVQPGIHYYYRLAAVDYNGNMSPVSQVLDLHTTGINSRGEIPEVYSLGSNYPNPFNPTTIIPYQIPENSRVTISVYDLSGRRIKTLVDTRQIPGYYDIAWDGTDNYGSQIATGVYIISMHANKFTQTRKVVFIK